MPANWQHDIIARVLEWVGSAKSSSRNFHFNMNRFQKPWWAWAICLLPTMIFRVDLKDNQLRVSLMIQHLSKLYNIYVDPNALWILTLLLSIWLLYSYNFSRAINHMEVKHRITQKAGHWPYPRGNVSFQIFQKLEHNHS